MKTLLLMLPLLWCTTASLAQPADNQPSSAVLQSCLLGTGPDQWGRLKLSPDQMRRMVRIQESCKLECEGAGVLVVASPVSDSDGDMIMDDVRNVLSTEQYTNWMAYCTAIGRGEPAPK